MRLDQDRFLTELHYLFERNESSGSVFLTTKRSAERPRKAVKTPAPAEADYGLLVRASDGKRKISTVVKGDGLAAFQASFSTILRAHATSLKKKSRGTRRKGADKHA